MPQFQVKLFQTAKVNTQTFEVEANSEEEAREKVEAEHLAGTDLKVNGEQYELVVDMVGTFIPEGPPQASIVEGEVVGAEEAPEPVAASDEQPQPTEARQIPVTEVPSE